VWHLALVGDVVFMSFTTSRGRAFSLPLLLECTVLKVLFSMLYPLSPRVTVRNVTVYGFPLLVFPPRTSCFRF